MMNIADILQIDFVDDGTTPPSSAQLGVPVDASVAQTSSYAYVEGAPVAVTANIKVAGGSGAAGKLELWAANDFVPQAMLPNDFEPQGWFKVADAITVAGAGVYGTTAPILVAFAFLQWRWNPSGGAGDTIQGTWCRQGRC